MDKKQLLALFLLMVVVLFLVLNKFSIENFDDNKNNKNNKNNKDEIYYDESGNISGIKTKYMGKLDYNNKVVAEFCKKLNQLDEPNEHNLLFKDFADKLIQKKQKVIENLKNDIEELQKSEVVKDLKQINNYTIKKDDMINKQLDVIEKAKVALSSNNKVKLNVL